jgi:hypothetical protein
MSYDVIPKLFRGGFKRIDYIPQENIYFTGKHYLVLLFSQDLIVIFLFTGKVAQLEKINLIHTPEFKGIDVKTNNFNGDPSDIKFTTANCHYYKNHIIFLHSKKEYEWLYLLLTFSSCPKYKL